MTIVIAEAGVNHNGSLEMAKQLIDYASEAGADIVKFQTFKAKNLCSENLPLAKYQSTNLPEIRSQYEMLKKLEISEEMHLQLLEYCRRREIEFLSTPFGFESIQFLDKLPVMRWKIPSGEIDNVQLLRAVSKTEKPIIISTGMSGEEEINFALDTIKKFSGCSKDITLLHCTTEYPAPFSEINLRSIEYMRERFKLPVGYSDHTEGIEASIAACALGASIIEKHFTIDKNQEGPDHKASIEPEELRALVKSIKNITIGLGVSKKEPADIEKKNILIVKKFIVAIKDIKAGEAFDEDNIGLQRTGGGIQAKYFFDILEKNAPRNFKTGEIIEIEDL